MTRMFRKFFSRLNRRDDGYVLIVVIGLGLLMVAMVATALTVTSSGEQKADSDTDWNGALAAAYAGIEDYTSRVENDSSYTRFGNPAAPFSSGSTGLTLPTGAAANPAFNITAAPHGARSPDLPAKLSFDTRSTTPSSEPPGSCSCGPRA